MLVKICGITEPGCAEAASVAGADLIGLVFVPGTPRAVSPDQVRGWLRSVIGVEVVGVFCDAPLDEVLAIRSDLGLDWVQLHGDEPDAWLDTLGESVLRRVPVGDDIDWPRVGELAERCLPLIDPGAGDGRAFDWDLLRDRPRGLRFGIAGGLGPDSVGEAVRIARPALVDVSSGVEASPGVKDPDLVRHFVEQARRAACRE